MNRASLVQQLERIVLELEAMIAEVVVLAHGQRVQPVHLRDATGGLMLAPLMTAQANALAALAQLEVTS